MIMKHCLIILTLMSSFVIAEPDKPVRGHVFAWPFIKTAKMQPRGGMTKGTDIVLAKESSTQWKALQDKSITGFEKDRLAILAMAGSYRVSFDFMETMGFADGYTPPKPYFSWGTEHVQVLKKEEKSISLQHTLVMYFKGKDGKEMGPMVMKHWRQDWTYEDNILHVYRGKSSWAKMTEPVEKTRGKWTQAVFQVDDSPRYEVVGKWSHQGGMSSWLSDSCWRPLPRREFSVRKDYDLLQGTHEITITPTGWVHLQRNQKVSLADTQKPRIIAQELGVNRYERIKIPSLKQAEVAWNKTGKYWQEVRKAWEAVYAANTTFSLKAKVDGKKLYQYHFDYAAQIEKAEGELDLAKAKAHARETIDKFLVPANGKRENEGKY
ncbi:MAG: hypothetical protein ACI9E1_001162 [Cryomorphaceae bacterium]|jgi:hypothetical protein